MTKKITVDRMRFFIHAHDETDPEDLVYWLLTQGNICDGSPWHDDAWHYMQQAMTEDAHARLLNILVAHVETLLKDGAPVMFQSAPSGIAPRSRWLTIGADKDAACRTVEVIQIPWEHYDKMAAKAFADEVVHKMVKERVRLTGLTGTIFMGHGPWGEQETYAASCDRRRRIDDRLLSAAELVRIAVHWRSAHHGVPARRTFLRWSQIEYARFMFRALIHWSKADEWPEDIQTLQTGIELLPNSPEPEIPICMDGPF